jgi:hypothetical protein
MKYEKIYQQSTQTPTASSSNTVRANIAPNHWLELTFSDGGPTKYSIVSDFGDQLLT